MGIFGLSAISSKASRSNIYIYRYLLFVGVRNKDVNGDISSLDD